MQGLQAIDALISDVRARLEPQLEPGHPIDHATFPGLAMEALLDVDACARVCCATLADWVVGTAAFPRQLDPGSRFGQPPVTIFRDATDRYAIDVYVWRYPELVIHNHFFSGACLVASGASLHAVYGFEDDDAATGSIRPGRLALRMGERLAAGRLFEIRFGDEFIHRTWHLENPMCSLVVRTPRLERPNDAFYAPGLRLSSGAAIEPRVSKGLALGTLHRPARASALALASTDTLLLLLRGAVARRDVRLCEEMAEHLLERAAPGLDEDFLSRLVGRWALDGSLHPERVRSVDARRLVGCLSVAADVPTDAAFEAAAAGLFVPELPRSSISEAYLAGAIDSALADALEAEGLAARQVFRAVASVMRGCRLIAGLRRTLAPSESRPETCPTR